MGQAPLKLTCIWSESLSPSSCKSRSSTPGIVCSAMEWPPDLPPPPPPPPPQCPLWQQLSWEERPGLQHDGPSYGTRAYQEKEVVVVHIFIISPCIYESQDGFASKSMVKIFKARKFFIFGLVEIDQKPSFMESYLNCLLSGLLINRKVWEGPTMSKCFYHRLRWVRMVAAPTRSMMMVVVWRRRVQSGVEGWPRSGQLIPERIRSWIIVFVHIRPR